MGECDDAEPMKMKAFDDSKVHPNSVSSVAMVSKSSSADSEVLRAKAENAEPRSIKTASSSTDLSMKPGIIAGKLCALQAESAPKLTNPLPISEAEVTDFSIYINSDLNVASQEMKANRLKQFQICLDKVNSDVRSYQISLSVHVKERSEEMKNIDHIVATAQSLRMQGIANSRKNIILNHIFFEKRAKIHLLESARLKACISKASSFGNYLSSIFSATKVCPIVDIDKFYASLPTESPKISILRKQISLLSRKVLKPMPSKPTNWYETIISPTSSTGKIIERFNEKVKVLKYNDVITIAERLNEGRNDYDQIEQLLFDLGWQKSKYPFGINRVIKLPQFGDLFPAVIGQTPLQPEFAYAPFSSLSVMNWPFKDAVDRMFEIMICTNPFDSASVFWDVIQSVADTMKRLLVMEKGMQPEDVEIDFDSLFPVLLICVLAFGQDEWVQTAIWTISFNEYSMNDPKIQFSVTYLEGLVTQLLALDFKGLKVKAKEMSEKWAEEQGDPLGLSKKKK